MDSAIQTPFTRGSASSLFLGRCEPRQWLSSRPSLVLKQFPISLSHPVYGGFLMETQSTFPPTLGLGAAATPCISEAARGRDQLETVRHQQELMSTQNKGGKYAAHLSPSHPPPPKQDRRDKKAKGKDAGRLKECKEEIVVGRKPGKGQRWKLSPAR